MNILVLKYKCFFFVVFNLGNTLCKVKKYIFINNISTIEIGMKERVKKKK